jgi:predicted DNA-binding protein
MSFRLSLNWEERLRALELATKRLEEYKIQPLYQDICLCRHSKEIAIKRQLRDVEKTLEETEDWKTEFTKWAESLVNRLFGRHQKEPAPRVNAIAGWMEHSPI